MAKWDVVLDYFSELTKGSGVIKGKCTFCNINIRGKVGVTSNFLTCLKVNPFGFCLRSSLCIITLIYSLQGKHIEAYDDLQKQKEFSMKQLSLADLPKFSAG